MPRRFQFRLRTLLGGIIVLGLLLGLGKWSSDAYIARQPAQLPWKPYSRSEMRQLQVGSRPVLVFLMARDGTGIGMLRMTLGDHAVAAQLQKHHFELRIADLTGPNPVAEKALSDYGSASFCLVAIHPTGKFDRPIILRDLVTKEQLLEAIEKATSPPEADESR